MDRGSITLEPSRSPIFPLNRDFSFSIPMEEVARTTKMATRMVMGMEEATARTGPHQQPQPRETRAMSPVSSVPRLDTTQMNVLKARMEMAMEALGRSQTLLAGDR